MHKINTNKKLIRILTMISILLLVSGLTAITSLANEIPPVPVNFYGHVALDGEWSQPGTVIKAYLGNESNPRVQYKVEFTGLYHLSIDGNTSDEGKIITFKINDKIANTATWHMSFIPSESHNLDLIIGDLPISPQPTSPYSKEDTNKDSSISKDITSPTATISETTTPTATLTAASTPTSTELEKSDIEDTNDTKETTDKTPISGFNIVFAVASLSIAMYLIKTKRA